MDSPNVPVHGRNYEEDPHNTGVGGEKEENEKKSVVEKVKDKAEKVKDKAKKIKHTLGKKIHGDGQDHREVDGNGHDEGYSDDEEGEEDPEIHGAPMYESTTAEKVVGVEEVPEHSRIRPYGEDQVLPNPPPKDQIPTVSRDQDSTKVTGPAYDSTIIHNPTAQVVEMEDLPAKSMAKDTGPLEEDPHAPKDWPETTSPSNYQTKVHDPTASGGHETGVPSLPRSFEAMKLSDEPSTGSHDHFSPDSPSKQNPAISQNSKQVQETPHSSQPSKISSATSAIAKKAVSAKNTIASKLGYGRNDTIDTVTDTSEKSAGIGDYGRKISATVTEKLSPVHGKVVEKIKGTEKGSDMEVSVTETEGGVKRSDKGVTVREYVAVKLTPGAEHKALSDLISDAIRKRNDGSTESASDQPAGTVSDPGNEKGVVGRIKGAVSSMFGMSGDSRASTASDSHSRGMEEEHHRKGE